jgi:hypothetical protein
VFIGAVATLEKLNPATSCVRSSDLGKRVRIQASMGIIADGQYKPREDLLAKAASLAMSIWGIPFLLAVAWAAFFACNRFLSPRFAEMDFAVTALLTFIAILIFTGQCVYVSITNLSRRQKFHSLRFGLVLTLTIAVGAGGLPLTAWAFGSRFVEAYLFWPCGLLLSCCWLAMSALFMRQNGTRGARLLVGAL